MKKLRLEELQESTDSIAAEIKRLEGDYSFVYEEAIKLADIKTAASNKKLVEDPKFIEMFRDKLGEDFLREASIESTKFLEEAVPIDKDKLKASLDWVVDALVSLHKKQISIFKQMSIEIDKHERKGHLEEVYVTEEFRDSIEESIKAHQEMINVYLKSKLNFASDFLK